MVVDFDLSDLWKDIVVRCDIKNFGRDPCDVGNILLDRLIIYSTQIDLLEHYLLN